MKVVFRCDASLEMGIGHLMRCLTLADALSARGTTCSFISRAHPGNLSEQVRQQGYQVYELPWDSDAAGISGTTAHSHWLGASMESEIADSEGIVGGLAPDWVVVDHYALDAGWERALMASCRRLMVIDDLADRSHQCDLLVDQTLGRRAEDYRVRVQASTTVLCGSSFAILRPEFAGLRPRSLMRRQCPRLEHILITMGGVDRNNITGDVLATLNSSQLPAHVTITVVLGATSPWIDAVSDQASLMRWPVSVRVGVKRMARLMTDCDLVIGAAGATSWERCCLGVPTVLITAAENQMSIARALTSIGAAVHVARESVLAHRLVDQFVDNPDIMRKMSVAAAGVTDGLGANRVISQMERLS